MQLKLDELIRAIQGAHNAVLDLEELDESDLDRLRADYETLAQQARANVDRDVCGTTSTAEPNRQEEGSQP